MLNHLLLSVSCEDKPGVVEQLSSAIECCGGNWLESRLANLRGRFVGMVWVAIPKGKIEEFKAALRELKHAGIPVTIDENNGDDSAEKQASSSLLGFYIVGPDRGGIIKEVSQALNLHQINVESLDTSLISAAYSGEAIFEARGQVSVPAGMNLSDLEDKLAQISDELGLTIDLE